MCQRETEEMEGDGGKTKAQQHEEVKIEADAYDEEINIVDTCLIEKVNRYETHEFEEMDKDNGLEVEEAMDHNMKEVDKCTDTSPPLFREAWNMVDGNISVGGERPINEESCPNNIMTQEKEGGDKKAKVKCNPYNEKVKQSTMMHNEGQANQMNWKSVSRDMITSSNSKWNTNVKTKQMMVYDVLCSGKAEETMTNNRAGANLEQWIWLFEWTVWLWWKEWSWWHWKKRDKEATSWFMVIFYHR